MTTRLNPAFLFYLGYGLLLALCLYFFVGCATYKATLPDGSIFENMALKEQTSYDVNGHKITQRAIVPVQNKDINSIVNALNGLILPWLVTSSPTPPQTGGTYMLTPTPAK